MTTWVAVARLRVTTGSTWSPTRTCPPRAMIRPRAGVTGTVCCWKTRAAVRECELCRTWSDQRRATTAAKAAALRAALLLPPLLLEAVQGARAHEVLWVPITLVVRREVRRLHLPGQT